MLTSQLSYFVMRRRLPKPPNVDDNNNTNSVLLDIGMQSQSSSLLTETQTETMNASPGKKRLTPEVVATLLSLDGKVDNGKSYSQRKSNSRSDKTRQIRDNDCCQATGHDIGWVEIVKKTGQPLGFSLREYGVSNGVAIIVSRLTAGGVVEEQSLLRVGDEILEINQVPVQGYKLSDVVAMIQIPTRLVLRVNFQQQNTEPCHNNHNNNHLVQAAAKDGGVRTGALCVSPQSTNQGNELQVSTGLNQGAPEMTMVRRNSGRLLPEPPPGQLDKTPDQLDKPLGKRDKLSGKLDKPPHFNVGGDNSYVDVRKTTPGNSSSLEAHLKTKVDSPKHNLGKKIENNYPPNNMSSGKTNRGKRCAVVPVVTTTGQSSLSRHDVLGRGYDPPSTNSDRVDPGDIGFDLVTNNNDQTRVPFCRQNDGLRQNDIALPSSASSWSTPQTRHRLVRQNAARRRSNSSDSITLVTSWTDSAESCSVTSDDFVFGRNSEQNLVVEPALERRRSQSPDELLATNASHNSWFSKINRINVRKLSEGLRSPNKLGATVSDPYRVNETRPSDEVDAGYRFYSGVANQLSCSQTPSTNPSGRAVTGMVALDIVKASNIRPPAGANDLASKDKRTKKIKALCTIDCDGVRQACTTVKKGLDYFQWTESFDIEFQRTKEFKVIVWSRSKKDGDRSMAECTVALGQLLSDGCSEHLLALCLEPSGTLYMKLQFTEMKVLLQRTPSKRSEGVFGVELGTLLRRENGKVPIIVKKCVEEINERGIEVTGIYRLCGNAAKKKILRALFETNSANVNLQQPPADVNVMTGLLKDYLRELPHPLLSQDIRELLYKASETDERSEASDQRLVNEVIGKFTRISKDTIVYLLDHFATVLMNSEGNKMDSHNLAVCIGPVLLCPSLGSMSSSAISDTKKDINAIRLLLEIWPKPEQVSAC